MDVGDLSALALEVWQFGLQDRGADVFKVARRVERALQRTCDPESVSRACRDLVSAGYADRSPFGYRRRQGRQLEIPS